MKKWGLFYGLTVVLGPKTFPCEIPHKNRFWISKKVKMRRKNGQRRSKEGFL